MRFAHFEFEPESDRLGEGPQSEVYRAVDTRLGRTVALKILRPHVEFDPAAKERFEREAKHTSNLAHPNIATIYEYGQDRGTSFIAMEYLEGRTLDRTVKERPLGYEEGLRIALQVSDALGLVHERGLIHRDLKPANVMLLADGRVKLLDFGICRSTGEAGITQEGMLVGTVLYMSPEQVLGDELDLRSDVWALGAVMYHALTGKLPFPGRAFPEVCMAILEARPRRPSEVRSGFPAPLEAFLLRCLSRDPAQRFADARQAHGALLAVAEELRLETAAHRPTPLRGRVLIPPFDVDGDSESVAAFAGGLRRDLSSELSRSSGLDVSLVEEDAVAAETAAAGEYTYVVRGRLDVRGTEGAVDFVIEQVGRNGGGATHALGGERIEHTDTDEWGLQGKLVGALARSVRRRISDAGPARSVAVPLERRDTARAETLARRAHAILHRGTTKHLMVAMSTFRSAIEADPSYALAHAGLAEALARKALYWDGDRTFLRESSEEARYALSLDSRCAEAHTAIGFGLGMTGASQEALREYRVAIEIDHEEWLAHRLLGALQGRLGNLKSAAPLLQRAIGLRPSHIGSYDHLYNVLRHLDRYEEALETADRGIAAAKKHLQEVSDAQEARLHLALLLARLGRADEAREQLARARQLFPKDAYTWFHAGCTEAVLGDVDAAVASLREARDRGFYLQSELLRNSDLDPLRSTPGFERLAG